MLTCRNYTRHLLVSIQFLEAIADDHPKPASGNYVTQQRQEYKTVISTSLNADFVYHFLLSKEEGVTFKCTRICLLNVPPPTHAHIR